MRGSSGPDCHPRLVPFLGRRCFQFLEVYLYLESSTQEECPDVLRACPNMSLPNPQPAHGAGEEKPDSDSRGGNVDLSPTELCSRGASATYSVSTALGCFARFRLS